MLTENQIKRGFWYRDAENDHPPKAITPLENYNQSEKLNLSLTPTDDKKYHNKLFNAWCEKLGELDKVKYLWLSCSVNQRIFDTACKMINLEGLHIVYNTAKNIDNLQNLKNLKHLYLGNSTKVENIEVLGQLTHLVTLGTENLKKHSDFSIISNLCKLEGLSIEGSMWTAQKINTLEPVGHLTELKYFSIVNSQTLDKSFEPILNLKKLIRFSSSYNYPASEFEKLRKLPKLKYCDRLGLFG